MVDVKNKVAVFIDAENINNPKVYPLIFEKLISEGYNPCLRRMVVSEIKNDLTQIIKENLFELTVSYMPKEHNNADFRMYIEILNVLYDSKYSDIDTYVIGSSDKGFTDLVITLKFSGKKVIGVGNIGGDKKKPLTSEEYKKLFDVFYYVEDVLNEEKEKAEAKKQKPKKAPTKSAEKKKNNVKKNDKEKRKRKNSPANTVSLKKESKEKDELYYNQLKVALINLEKKKFEFQELKNTLKKKKIEITKEDILHCNAQLKEDSDKIFVDLSPITLEEK